MNEVKLHLRRMKIHVTKQGSSGPVETSDWNGLINIQEEFLLQVVAHPDEKPVIDTFF
jgi:hypothetical protein